MPARGGKPAPCTPGGAVEQGRRQLLAEAGPVTKGAQRVQGSRGGSPFQLDAVIANDRPGRLLLSPMSKTPSQSISVISWVK